MYGEKGIQLIREAARSEESLAPFNEDIVRQTLEETRNLWDENRAEVALNSTISPAITLRHAAIERNKRCLLAYLNNRMETIREMRWQFGAVLPEGIRLNLAEPELEFSR
ncbi:DNA replication complex GINS protein PSF1 [Eurytemora carolleeae]|uniref:DNA replication complex GINS protein PSF1 n=1 Tax=Eurytemora carolleeae TaxID=1294199 RepID=UPI000C792E9B|nr:DNA replication complex GINS protein PSF1 [Eurytemora carolleeae]|eukprot:XP_023330026.1 DNA replication complex GINS protein PSF1-like [Eurytemora affinis]